MGKAVRILGGMLVILTLLGAGCSSGQKQTAQEAPKQEASKAPPNLVVGLVAEPVSTDPQQLTDINSMRVVINLYDTLVGFSPKSFKIEPRLAESWKISDDGKEYTFKLRQGVKFHDGTPFDANAVKFTFDRMLDEKHPFYKTGPFPFAKFFFGAVKEVRAVDPSTVTFVLNEPFGPFLNNLTLPTAALVSPQAVEKAGKDFALQGVGTGAFKFKSWEKGTKLVLEANKDYWGGAPKVNEIIFRPITEDLVRVTELQTGGVDIIADPNPDSIAGLKANNKFKVLLEPGPHVWWVGLNTSKKPLDDVRVRQAINYAIDKKAIADEILKGTGSPSTGPLAPVLMGFTKETQGYSYDPERAKSLLKEAGAFNVKLNFLVPESGSGMQSPVPMATAVQSYLKAVGVDVEIQKMEWGAFLERIQKGAGKELDMWALSWMAGAGDPDMVLSSLLASTSFPPGFNTGYYKNAAVDDLLKQGRVLSDPNKRRPLYEKAYDLISKDAPWIFIDHAQQAVAQSSKVSGFELEPNFLFYFKNVSVNK